MDKSKKIFRVTSATIVFVGICMSIYNNMFVGPFDNGFLNIVKSFTYFTVLSNILVTLWFLFNSGIGLKNKLLNGASSKGAIMLYISVAGIVYFTILNETSTLTSYPLIATYILHAVSPVLFILDWIVLEKKGEYIWGDIKKWVLFPISYLIYVVILCGILREYPYGFMDLSKLSIKAFSINMIGLTSVFVFLSALIILLDKVICKISTTISLTQNT